MGNTKTATVSGRGDYIVSFTEAGTTYSIRKGTYTVARMEAVKQVALRQGLITVCKAGIEMFACQGLAGRTTREG